MRQGQRQAGGEGDRPQRIKKGECAGGSLGGRRRRARCAQPTLGGKTGVVWGRGHAPLVRRMAVGRLDPGQGRRRPISLPTVAESPPCSPAAPWRRLMDLGVVDLSRLQFALTAMYHFLFVPLTLGLSMMLFAFEAIYVMSGREIWKRITKFWATLFGINF